MPMISDILPKSSQGTHASKTSGAVVRLPALTGLRIFAALAVFASHVGPPHGASSELKAFFESGYMGVTLFFTLSGFVLAINYFDRLGGRSASAVWQFGVARLARIYPLYILILFFILVRQHAFGIGINGWWEHVLMIQAWNSNLAQVYNFNGPAWSVSVEFFLYACFPVLVLILTRVRTPRTVLLMAFVIGIVMAALAAWFVLADRANLPWPNPESAHRWLYVIPVTRLGDFTLGILAARLYVFTRGNSVATRAGGSLAIVAALTIVFLMSWPANVYSAWSWDVAYAIPSVILIFGLAVAPLSISSRILSLPALVLLGESSYAFYLIHEPALEYLGPARWSIATSPTTIILEVMMLGGILCLAIGLHIAVERPARLYIRRLLSFRHDRAKNRREEAATGHGLGDTQAEESYAGTGPSI
jgi:peptidoglycan/LPS O-acetylase OafA/YrhL